MYAIIETGGKQYTVKEGDLVKIEKLSADQGDAVVFDVVLAVADGNGKLTFGQPTVKGAKVSGKVIAQDKEKKVIVYKFQAKKNVRRKRGHRQPFTKVLIEKIQA